MSELIQEATRLVESAREEGRAAGLAQAQQQFLGAAASTVTLSLFADALEGAAARLQQYDPRVAAMLAQQAELYREAATPPRVVATVPQADAVGVPPGSPVSAQFERRIDPASLTAETFWVAPAAGGSRLTGRLAWDAGTLTVAFTPANELSAGVAYRAHVEGVTNRVGFVGSAQEWTFAVANA